MLQQYSKTTQSILDDFFQQLERHPEVDPDFLRELQTMAREGKLGSPTRIRQVTSILEKKANALEDWTSSDT